MWPIKFPERKMREKGGEVRSRPGLRGGKWGRQGKNVKEAFTLFKFCHLEEAISRTALAKSFSIIETWDSGNTIFPSRDN